MIPLHELAPNLSELREIKRPLFEKVIAEERAAVNPPSRYRQEYLRGEAVRFGFYALAIERDDALAAGYFRQAADCALAALSAPRAEPPVKSRDINVVVDPDTLETEVVSVVPSSGYGAARMSVIEFQAAFFTLAAFGQDSAWAVAGGIVEKDYRSPGIIANDNYYAVIRSYKARAVGDKSAGIAEIATAVEDPEAAARPDVKALLALDVGDEMSFRGNLLALLKKHRKLAQKSPGAISMVMQAVGMALCRLAFRQGIRIEDQNYLPLRFAPWYK